MLSIYYIADFQSNKAHAMLEHWRAKCCFFIFGQQGSNLSMYYFKMTTMMTHLFEIWPFSQILTYHICIICHKHAAYQAPQGVDAVPPVQ